jgi:hypothetical protein
MLKRTLILACLLATPALSQISDEANACIDELRSRFGNVGGEVLGQEGGQAGILVRLRDASGTESDCIVWSGPTVADLSRVGDESDADDGGGALAGADTSAATITDTQRVNFDKGTSGTAMTATLDPGTSVRYVLGAKEGQFLNVDVASLGGAIDYRIENPDGSALLDLVSSDTPYRGQLWQSGDHVVQISNAGAQPVSFDVGIGIE